jgi:hypothetical protein
MSVLYLYFICRVYVVYPDEFHNGLWGGEGVVKGMLKRQAQRKRINIMCRCLETAGHNFFLRYNHFMSHSEGHF